MRLVEAAKTHRLITVELIPDRVVPGDLILLRGRVDGITIPALRNGSQDPSYPVEFRVTPQQRSIASAVIVKRRGIESIPSLTCRDCSKSDLASVAALRVQGLENFLVLFGDPYAGVDFRKYDFPKTELLIREVFSAFDGDRPCVGAVTNQYATNREREVTRTLGKVEAGADFVITNVAFDGEVVLEHLDALRSSGLNVPLVIQVSIPGNLENLLFVGRKFGIPVPDHVKEELLKSPVDGASSVAVQAFQELRQEAQGIHFSYLFRSRSPIPSYCKVLDRIGVSRPIEPIQVEATNGHRNLA